MEEVADMSSSMKKFLNENKVINICLICAVIIIYLYIWSVDKKEWFLHAGIWFELLFDLSVGFVINYIFYMTQVYIPRNKQMQQVNECIGIRINNILTHMDELFNHLFSIYLAEYDHEMKPTDEQFLKIFKQINLNDRVNVINITKRYLPDSDASYFTVREWIDSRVQFVNIEIDKMLKYYSPYINSELMMIMEEILKSSMHNVMFNIILKSPNNSSFAECDTDFILKPYYELMEKLKEISKEYQL